MGSTAHAGGGRDVESLADAERDFYNDRTRMFDALRRVIWRAIGEFQRADEIERYFDAGGKAVLEYGCGASSKAQALVDAGATHVTGFDISEAEIERARDRAERDGYADRTQFVVADAHQLPFPDDAFELIVGRSILHHLDLGAALPELRRVLKPGGRAVFSEPMAHNPLLRLGRHLTPAARTPDEHPFTVDDWRLCQSVFPDFQHVEVEFLTIPLMPVNLVLPRRFQRRFAAAVGRWDDRLLARRPSLRPMARLTFLVFE